jgi:hypothetical protein
MSPKGLRGPLAQHIILRRGVEELLVLTPCEEASRSVESSSIRDVRTHTECCCRRVSGKKRIPSSMGIACPLRGDETCFEECFASR